MTYAKKGLGQHFLMHAQTSARIAESANVTKVDTVLEIGPGTGVLTRALLLRSNKVIAVETDDDLIPVLLDTFPNEIREGKLELIHQDIRVFDPITILGDYKLVANIPYYITGEIVRQFLSASHKPRSMTLLVQKEVAERVARSKKESLLSIAVKVYGSPRYLFTVPKGAFKPAPKVDSAVLGIENIQNPFGSREEELRFFEVVRAGFAHKRKRLQKNLEEVAEKSAVASAFHEAKLDENVRSEDVSLATWKEIARQLSV